VILSIFIIQHQRHQRKEMAMQKSIVTYC